jgi:hypothetical protein
MKTKQRRSDSVTFVRRGVFLDDLEHILALLNEKGFTPQITEGDWLFESLDDLKENRGLKPRAVKIAADGENNAHSIFLSFGAWGHAHISYSGDDATRLLWSDIRGVISPDRFWRRPEAPIMLLWLAPILIWIDPHKPSALTLWLYIMTFSTLVLFSVYNFARPTVYLERRHAAAGFWTRNGEKIVLALVSAVIGAAVTLLVKSLF